MKKVMLTAAVAALATGAFASCADGPGDPGTPPKTYDAAVYQWKFTGKTGVGVLIKGTADKTVKGGCADDTVTPGIGDEAVRVPGSLAIEAYTYICDDECFNFGTYLVNPTAAQYRGSKPWKTLVYESGVGGAANFISAIDCSEVIGKNGSQYELAGSAKFLFNNAKEPSPHDIAYEVYFAGFGSYDKKHYRLSSVCGNFAGTQTPPRYNGEIKGLPKCPPADYWLCEYPGVTLAGDAMHASVAYGCWSVKYNASASKKLKDNKNYRVLTTTAK